MKIMQKQYITFYRVIEPFKKLAMSSFIISVVVYAYLFLLYKQSFISCVIYAVFVVYPSLKVSVSTLRDYLDAVYDVTILYESRRGHTIRSDSPNLFSESMILPMHSIAHHY